MDAHGKSAQASNQVIGRPDLFGLLSRQRVQEHLTKFFDEREKYIALLEQTLRDHGIEVPEKTFSNIPFPFAKSLADMSKSILKKGTPEEMKAFIDRNKHFIRENDLAVEFYDLTLSTTVPVEDRIYSISTIFQTLCCFWKVCHQPQRSVNIISNLTGRILPRKMTLLIGPPASGKSVFLKALAGRLRPLNGAKLSGEVYYDGDPIHSKKFETAKVSDYIHEDDIHSAVLTVEETLTYAWQCTTKGHHSYGRAKDDAAAAVLDQEDATKSIVQNVITLLGLKGCKDTYVGDQMTRGVSGGEKRRVTIGEMIILPRPVKFMDSITTGLDTATAYDIIQSISILNHSIGLTNLIALLQPPPDVFNLFDEIILLCEGHIIYQGSREQVLTYFQALGYHCPHDMDVADFLQELPTKEGQRFVTEQSRVIAHTPSSLAIAWKASHYYTSLLQEMKYASAQDAKQLSPSNPKQWYPDQSEKYAARGDPWFYLQLNYYRQMKILVRDNIFLRARFGQVLIVGAIAGSLFSNIDPQEVSTMNGCLFNSLLFQALGSIAIFPILYAQKAVFYKMKDALFFPTWSFTIAQTVTMIPLQLTESILYSTIVYWSAGLSDEYNGSRFLTFIVIASMFAMVIAALFRWLSSMIASPSTCLPVAGIILVVMVLFSGFIQPPKLISDGWIWFYYLNPTAWALKAVTINEFTSSKYDFVVCTNYPTCTETKRFGDVVLEQSGVPTNPRYIWYSYAVLVGEFFFFLILGTIALEYVRTENAPAAPHRSEEDGGGIGGNREAELERMKKVWEQVEKQQSSSDKKEETTPSEKKEDNDDKRALLITPTNQDTTDRKEEGNKKDMNETDEEEEEKKKKEREPPPIDQNNSASSKGPEVLELELVSPTSPSQQLVAPTTATPTGTAPDRCEPGPSNRSIAELPFDPVTLAFSNIWYTVTLANKEDIDLLKGVSGYFEPGTMTALMGSSGAGKTTLLDVLAGRKNSGVIKGEMTINGYPKVERAFRKIMGYVEQFDTLPEKSTAREAIEFSALLRLASSVTSEETIQWVNSVLKMLDLQEIENQLIGSMGDGGMSFEQRKRVSIGVELAANPSILFLDEPTTGLDSLAAQSLIRNIRKIAASGRSIVCTIHQPSSTIFNAFDSLLLLRRGGKTVYFGSLGEQSEALIEYFEKIPGINPMPRNTNPATWMLEIIGAGTATNTTTSDSKEGGGGSTAAIDYHSYYKQSHLYTVNELHLQSLMTPNEGSQRHDHDDTHHTVDTYNASYTKQFRLLMQRIALTYWRTPDYSLLRHFTYLIIALIFGSAYPQQKYTTYVATVSRSAVIFITALFCGVISMILVQPIMVAQRAVFYREQQARMYAVWVYAITLVLVEIPYLLVASLSFTLPFFYIVGFNHIGDTTQKFFWYWLFIFLLQSTMLFLSAFFVALTPNQQTAQVLGGLFNTINGLFCGYLIQEQNYPTFWLFMYWLNPLHYTLEGLIMTQFHDDTTLVTTLTGKKVTAEYYIDEVQFSTWSYSHVGYDVLALCIFCGVAILGMYLSLAFLRHDKR